MYKNVFKLPSAVCSLNDKTKKEQKEFSYYKYNSIHFKNIFLMQKRVDICFKCSKKNISVRLVKIPFLI